MNEPTVRLELRPETRPAVSAFVHAVRARLADLTVDEREELVGGLEADIHELVADGGTLEELGDPRAYADELRAAAGLARAPLASNDPRRGRGRSTVGSLVGRAGRLLDRGRAAWLGVVAAPALRVPWDFLTTLRPVWWVLRAWVAIQLLDLATQGGDLATPVPTLGGPLVGSLVWLVAIVVSVQMGRGRIWPGAGPDRSVLARVVLLSLNGFAVLVTPVVLGQFPASGTWDSRHFVTDLSQPEPGLSNGGAYVENVFPYDAEGRPLTGVQLFDQDGRPLRVARWASETYHGNRVEVVYPWLNGQQRLYNVFPLPLRDQDMLSVGTRVEPDAWTSANPPLLPTPPLAVVPPVSLPGPAEPPVQEPADPAEGDDGTRDPESRPRR